MSNDTGRDDPNAFSSAVVAAITNGNKIEAIKLLRKERGIGLKEAKEAVEGYVEGHPALAAKLQSEGNRGCLLWLAALIAIATIAYYVVSGKS